MVEYPDTVPIDGATIVINAVRNGLAPAGQHGDLPCVLHATWNLVGFGLSVGVPHVHLYADARVSIAELPELLEPATVKGAKKAAVGALPWAKILPLLLALLQLLAFEQKAS